MCGFSCIPLFICIFFILIRKSKFLRIYFHSKLYRIGIQIGKHIYTPVCDIHSDFRYFDLVFLRKQHSHLDGYRIFHQECFRLTLQYIEAGQHLVYEIDGKHQDHLYLEGTPFQVTKGILILYQKKRKGLSFISEEIKRSNQWPMK